MEGGSEGIGCVVLALILLLTLTACDDDTSDLTCMANADCGEGSACVAGTCIDDPSDCERIGALVDITQAVPQHADHIHEMHLTLDSRGAVHYCYWGTSQGTYVSYYGRQLTATSFKEEPLATTEANLHWCGGLTVTPDGTPFVLSRAPAAVVFKQDNAWQSISIQELTTQEASGALKGEDTVVSMTWDGQAGIYVSLSLGFEVGSQPIFLARVNPTGIQVLLNGWSETGDYTATGFAPQFFLGGQDQIPPLKKGVRQECQIPPLKKGVRGILSPRVARGKDEIPPPPFFKGGETPLQAPEKTSPAIGRPHPGFGRPHPNPPPVDAWTHPFSSPHPNPPPVDAWTHPFSSPHPNPPPVDAWTHPFSSPHPNPPPVDAWTLGEGGELREKAINDHGQAMLFPLPQRQNVHRGRAGEGALKTGEGAPQERTSTPHLIMGRMVGFNILLADSALEITTQGEGGYPRVAPGPNNRAFVLYTDRNLELYLDEIANDQFHPKARVGKVGLPQSASGRVPWDLAVDAAGGAHLLIEDATHGPGVLTYQRVDPMGVVTPPQIAVDTLVATLPGMQTYAIRSDICERATIAAVVHPPQTENEQIEDLSGKEVPVIAILEER
ncbi:MAG: hypothetical protein QNJ97_20460 [Myxococcota bacterium]|nr:hypothetical protein [Myxococcota bacterium]